MVALTPPPTAPSTADKSTFSARADALIAWFATFVAEMTVLVAAIYTLVTGSPFALIYNFSTTTTDSDPGAGTIRLSNATQNIATVMRVDELAADGTNQATALDLYDDSTSTTRGYLKLVKADDTSKWLLFAITSMASPSGYRNFTVTAVTGSAASPFANGDRVILEFTRTGDKGDTGATGETGTGGTPAFVRILTSGTSYAATNGSITKIKVRGKGAGGGGSGNGTTRNGGSVGGSTTFNSVTAVGGPGAVSDGIVAGGGNGGGDNGFTVARRSGQPGNACGWYSSGADATSIIGAPGGGSGGGIGGARTGAAGGNAVANSGGGGGGAGMASKAVSTAAFASFFLSQSGGEGEEFEVWMDVGSYAYAIGAGGAGGAAGTSGYAGGDGAAGVIVVEEYI